MKDHEQIASDWAARGFSCELWTDPPGQRWEDFTHATDEVVIVLEGEMEFEVEGEAHHPQTGEEIFIPAGRFTRRQTSATPRHDGCSGIASSEQVNNEQPNHSGNLLRLYMTVVLPLHRACGSTGQRIRHPNQVRSVPATSGHTPGRPDAGAAVRRS